MSRGKYILVYGATHKDCYELLSPLLNQYTPLRDQ